MPLGRLSDELTTLVSKAAKAILAFDPARVARRMKADRSPVTAADEAAETVILEGLAHLLPGVPVISEEAIGNRPAIASGATYLLVDPLDGTKEFLAGRNEFTVNIALIRDGLPVLGCIAAPALGLVWRGIAGAGAERLDLPAGATLAPGSGGTPIRVRTFLRHEVVALTSRSHFEERSEAFLRRLPGSRLIGCGSSLKFCRLAEGAADVYPRLAPTHEWDIAAGNAILVAAGGAVSDLEGKPVRYGNAAGDYIIPGFVAWGDPAAAARFAIPHGGA
jgi:3'(2'), 5'-bisphosphate nucleotidase